MPTQPGTPGTPLDTKQAAEKFAGLIIESGPDDEPPETDAVAPSDVEAAEEKPTPPASPPQNADTEFPATDEEAQSDLADVVFHDEDGHPVTRGEAQKGYYRQADYTRKTQALAEKEKRLEPELRARLEREVQDTQAQYVDGLARVRQALDELQGEPNWAELRGKVSDAEFLKQRADWEAQKSQRERLRQHEDEERQKLQAAQAKQYQEFVRAEYDKLLEQIPDWKETEKAKSEISQLKGFAKKQYGFDDAAINNGFSTAAIVLLIRDAMKYHELKKEPSAQVKAKVAPIKTAKPGTPARPRPNERQEKLIERAAKTGRHRDAQAAIEALIGD